MGAPGFRFGLEGEYLLVAADSYRPLWHPDLNFAQLNAILETIPFQALLGDLSLEGLELDPPHRRLLPYCVEGYGLPGPELSTWTDLQPKGIEIRTPVCPSIQRCLSVYEDLYQALQTALAEHGYRAVVLSHHPTAWSFHGPQNHPRHDWWQWGMQAMTTYGPDLNLSLPEQWRPNADWGSLQRRVNYYAPALVAFSLASPVARGKLWTIGGRPGLSLRTYRRSPFAPAVAAHPKEQGRLELKAFDMPIERSDFGAYFLLWLWLVLDVHAPGSADDQDRIYELGSVARLGWETEGIIERAEEVLDRAAQLLPAFNVDPAGLERLRQRLQERRVPADALIQQLRESPSVEELLFFLDQMAKGPEGPADYVVIPKLSAEGHLRPSSFSTRSQTV